MSLITHRHLEEPHLVRFISVTSLFYQLKLHHNSLCAMLHGKLLKGKNNKAHNGKMEPAMEMEL